MEKRYIIKDLSSGNYYAGLDCGWCDMALYAEEFKTKFDAECFIKTEKGKFIIETIYLV
jgi:hypothetical protein